MANRYVPLETRFWGRVDKRGEDDCWNWTGCVSRGYGIIHAWGKYQRVPRVSYQMFKGEIPDGMFVCHTCDNPLCINPKHLFVGTPKDNMQDMIRKGRKVICPGESNGVAKLTSEEAIKIYLLKDSGMSQIEVGKMFGVGFRTISEIWLQHQWKTVTGGL